MSRRLRRDEPPHPTPAYLVSARHSVELMEARSSGATYDAIAARFGLQSADAAARTIARDRDRLRPANYVAALDLELDATSMLVDRMFGRMVTAEANDHGRRWFTRGCALLDHHHQLIKLKQDHAGERGEAGAAVEAPSWTEVLDLRARGLSFHSIATSDGLDDPYDANVLVTHHLDAFLCAAVTRLRAQQVADLERQWVRVWPDVIVGSMPNPTALAGATQILRARARVRGLYVAKPVVEPEHGFEPRRWGDPNRRRCCGTTRRVS